MKLFVTLLFIGIQLSLFGQYRVYKDLTNLFSQSVIETRDGGLLLVASEDCYTPGEVTIEGCMYALHLVRTTSLGDTIWTNRISFSGSVIRIFENEDDSFTFFCNVPDNFECDNVGIGLFGWSAVRILNITSTGQLQSTAQFPPTCEMVLKDVVQLSDSLFGVLAIFSKPLQWPPVENEGRLMILNRNGTIFNEINSPGDTWSRGRFLITDPDTLEMLYIDTFDFVHLVDYDLQLNEISHITNVDLDLPCLEKTSNPISRFRVKNGDIILTCREKIGSDYYFNVLRLEANLQLITTAVNNFNAITNMVELPNGNFIVASSGINDPVSHLNTTLVYLDAEGAYFYSQTIEYPEIERPTQIRLMDNDSIILAGNMNCCNMDPSIGPGKSFLLFGDFLSTSTKDDLSMQTPLIFPNPANQQLFILANKFAGITPNQLLLFDALGRLVVHHQLLDISQPINISMIDEGLYFYVLAKNNDHLASGKVVIY